MRLLIYTAAVAVGASLAIAGTAEAQSSLRVGQTVQGSLRATDAKMAADNTPFRCYQFQTKADNLYVVSMSSDQFDTYLLANSGSACGAQSVSNDDGPDMGTNSQVELLGDGQVWSIAANTISSDQLGAYSLRVDDRGRMMPTRDILPISAGQSTRGELAMSDRRAEDSSFYDCYVMTADRNAKLAIRMDSSEFDTYLSLHSNGTCEGEAITTDDDSGGDMNALIEFDANPGTYSIRANTVSPGDTGDYTLSITYRR